jgi:hypothetical protein
MSIWIHIKLFGSESILQTCKGVLILGALLGERRLFFYKY